MPFSLWTTISRPGGQIVGDQGRQADAEIDVGAVGNVLRCAPRHLAAGESGHVGFATATTRSTKMPGVCTAFGVERAKLHHLAHLRHREARRRRHHRIEVPRRLAIDEIAPAVAALGLEERHVGLDRRLEHVQLAVDGAALLALAEPRSGRDAREETADPGAAGADALAQRALRHQFELDPAGAVERFEHMRVGRTRVRADHLAHPALADEESDAALAGAGVVGDDGKVARAVADQRFDQLDRLADIAEAGAQHGHAVRNARDRRLEARHALVDHQKLTRSPPFRSSMVRASAGLAISSDRLSRMVRMRRTCSAFDFASWPLPR